MAIKTYNASLRNLEYRLRRFKDILPQYLDDIIFEKEDVIVSAIRDDQLYRRGINGKGEKIMDYAPYALSTIRAKQKKGQPTTRVTLRDTGAFYEGMYVAVTDNGFFITSSDPKSNKLVEKYGSTIFRLTNENFTRIVRVHIRRELEKRLKQAIKG